MEIETITETIIIDDKKKFTLLKDIKEQCDIFVKNIANGYIAKSYDDYNKIIKRIETCSELNYYFLRYLKENNVTYMNDGEKWDYKKNLEILEETLTCKHYSLLEQNKRPDPLYEITDLLKEFVNVGNSKKKGRRSKYLKLKKEYPLKFIKLNYPLISGIERLRTRYYRDLIIEKNISSKCVKLNPYIKMIEKDKEIFNNSLDTYNFNQKIYLLILTLTQTFNSDNADIICNFFTKKITNTDNKGVYENIKLLEGKKYLVTTSYEKRIINGDDYILAGLQKDLRNNSSYPLEILLLRNESYQKFQKDGGKGFLDKLGLYKSFIDYIKYFLKSTALKEALNKNKSYENLLILLDNDNYLDEMLSENHFRFLPFYGAFKHYGYTNKDLMVSFINSIPELTDHLKIDDDDEEEEEEEDEDINENQIIEKEDKNMIMEKEEEGNETEMEEVREEEENKELTEKEKEENKEEKEEDEYLEKKIKNLTNISLLFTIGVKFITSLHEFVIHLMHAYNYYFSERKERKIYTTSYKEGKYKDEGDTFEKILNGGKRFDYLDINSVIYLLDGMSCNQNLEKFQKDLNSEIDLEKINDRIKKGEVGGFLAEFIKKYPINFDYIKDPAYAPKIFCSRSSEYSITIDRAGPDTYGGGKAI